MCFRQLEATGWRCDIFIAGCGVTARQALRAFCEEGLCVTIDDTEFIYTRGAEAGVRIGLVDYPRFPKGQDELERLALKLARELAITMYQDSVLVQFLNRHVWLTRRHEGG